MLKFYFHQTPNPMKVALYLAETGLPFELIAVDTVKGEQHTPEYRAINPNAKAPAIVDGDMRVLDSNAILLYLAEKTGKLAGQAEERGELLSWMMFIASGLGPFSGQAVHFQHVAKDSAYATNRYLREAQRHYEVLDQHLASREFIVADEYTIADVAAWGWIDKADRVLGETGLAPYPNLKRWFDAINARPAVAEARSIGQELTFKADFDEETQRAMFPSNFDKVKLGQ